MLLSCCPNAHKPMKISTFLLAFSSVVLLLFTACSQEKTVVNRGFYFWKNNQYQLTEDDELQLKSLRTEKLYVKFFEVAPDAVFGAIPTAKTTLRFYNYQSIEDTALKSVMDSLEIIPTVFVRNETLKNTRKGEIDSLADNIVFLIDKYYDERFEYQPESYSEIQIDCDWTPSTKDNYFLLLKAIKRYSKKTLSCTLRLYPYKYSSVMGIPPVDKATLMCYNLINPLAFENKNSILENEELEAYLAGVKKYPIHLDIVLPVFSWIHVYQNKQFVGIIDRTDEELKEVTKKIRPMWYEVTQDFPVDELYLKQGDLLKYEEVSPETIRKTIALLKKHIQFDDATTISLFHLDGAHLTRQNHEDLLSFYTDFGK
jgi:hypothetical protein